MTVAVAVGVAVLSLASAVGADDGFGDGGSASVAVAAGQTRTVAKSVHLDARPPSADVVLAFDTTGSMGAAIAQAKADATDLVNSLEVEFGSGNVRFDVVDFRDYDVFDTNQPDPAQRWPYKERTDGFTTSAGLVQSAIDALSPAGGTDAPEAYFGVFGKVATLPTWKPGAERFLVVLGDETGHDPNQATTFPQCPNGPEGGVVDPGLDGAGPMPAARAVSLLVQNDVTLSFVSYRSAGLPSVPVACHDQLASPTGGTAVDGLDSEGGTKSLSTLIEQLVTRAATHVNAVSVGVSSSGESSAADWVTLDGPTLGEAGLDTPNDLSFTVAVAPPAGTAPGLYGVDLAVTADGVLRATQHLDIEVHAPLSAPILTVDEASVPAGVKNVPIGLIPADRLALSSGSAPPNDVPLGSTPIASTPIASTPIASTPIASTPIASTPIASTPIASTPIASTPIASTALSHVLLSQVQLIGKSWDDVLCAPLLGQPLQAVTLLQVTQDACSNTKFGALTLGQVDLSTTLLRGVHWGSLLLGNLPLASITDIPGGFASWSDVFSNLPGTLNPLVDTLFSVEMAGGVPKTDGIGSIPIASTPIASTPIASTPIASTNVTSSRLASIRLDDISPIGNIVDCSALGGSCAGKSLGDAFVAHAVKPSAHFDDPALTAAYANAGITLNDLVTAVLGASDFPWERLPVQGLQAVPGAGTGKNATYHLQTTIDCSLIDGTELGKQFHALVLLPNGFFPVAGSSTVSFDEGGATSIPDPIRPSSRLTDVGAITHAAASTGPSNVFQWTASCPASVETTTSAVVTFKAYAGLTLGPDQTSSAAVEQGGATLVATDQAPIAVGQNWEPNDDPDNAPAIAPDSLVVGHIAASGDQDFYKLPVGTYPRGTKIAVYLSHVAPGADFDLTIAKDPAPGFFSAPIASTPIASTPIEDTPLGPDNSGTALPSEALQDVAVGSAPIASTPIASTSTNRGNADEVAQYVSQGEGGVATIGVSGYNGSASNSEYVLRVKVTLPPDVPACVPLTLSLGSPGTLPPTLPTSTKTLFLVNKQRLTALSNSTAVSNLMTSLNTLAARSEVSGAILPVDGNAAVRNAYASWDTNRCSPDAANAVVRSVNDVVAGYRAAGSGLPNLHYIVLLGNDNALPMARTIDPVQLSPEVDEASDLAFTTANLTQGNPLYASAAGNNILTDGAYGAFLGIPWLGRNLLLPQVSVSRLVETPDAMRLQIAQYLTQNGVVAGGSGVVTGYDFLADGATTVRNNLVARGATVGTVLGGHDAIGNNWSATDLKTGVLQAGTPASILSPNGHYNHYEAEAADGTLASTSPLDTTAALPGRVIFTMGCHGGLNVPGTGGKSLDWPELYSSKQVAMYIGNTGFGYGDDRSVALSERLLALYAKNLHSDAGSVGEQWAQTLQQYFATAGAYAVYDEKVMEEATFYGLPFWHFATAGASTPPAPLATTTDPGTGTQVANVTVTSNPTLEPSGIWTDAGQTAFGLYRPIQPLTTQEVTSATLPARGLWITALQTEDHTGVTPRLGMPTVDLAAHEPAPNIAPIFFPASPFTLAHTTTFSKNRDFVNVTGQFRPDPATPGQGTERLVRSVGFRVFYSNSVNLTPPLISQVDVSFSGGTATVTSRISANGAPVRLVKALVNDGTWHPLDLVQSSIDPTIWSASLPGLIAEPEVFVEATDGVSVSYSANKGSNFTSTTSTAPKGPEILLQAPQGPYAPGQVVNASYRCVPNPDPVTSCVGSVPDQQPLDTTTFGQHTFTVTATDSAGQTSSLQRSYFVRYPFDGFFEPVENEPTINAVKAGSAIPVKFSLGGDRGLDIFADGYPKSQTISCDASAPADGIETTVSAGQSSLQYDAGADRYTYVWKTDKPWANTCRALVLKTKDGIVHRATFKFK